MTTQNGVLALRVTKAGIEVYRARPTVPEVLPLVRALYSRKGGGAGCHLHVVLDDRNVGNGFVAACLDDARRDNCAECIALAETLLQMSTSQRARLSKARWRTEPALRKSP